MNNGALVQGVVLAHGAMAHGLVDAVARISGVAEGALVAVSNDGKSPEALQEEVEELLGQGPVIIFTDLPSGSCAVTARICCREESDEAVVFGVNLPVLLDFVFHRDYRWMSWCPGSSRRAGRGSTSVPEYPGSRDR